MKVLVIGSGGREDALAWKLKRSHSLEKIFIAPGNAGTDDYDGINVPIQPMEIEKLIEFAKEKEIDLTVVGPEAPLVAGIVNKFQAAGLKIFGPTMEAAQLEGSKKFAKEFMVKFNIPTAVYQAFDEYEIALKYVDKHFKKHPEAKIAIKADGLAAGKGVIICENFQQAKDSLKIMMLDKKFSDAGSTVVIEEFLEGEEISIMAMCDGTDALLMLPSQDHKLVGKGDTGPNTGGMGAFAPVPWVTDELMAEIKENIIIPTLRGMKSMEMPFSGCLYAGLMITNQGPKVVEFNVRFGDPETQPLMDLLLSDLVEIMLACAEGRLKNSNIELKWSGGFSVCVVLASQGYPGKYKTGFPIRCIEAAHSTHIVVFHAGTAKDDNGDLITSGGRVVGVTAGGDTLPEAIQTANKGAKMIKFDNKYYRDDIGSRKSPTFLS